jgi:hypothetical protein
MEHGSGLFTSTTGGEPSSMKTARSSKTRYFFEKTENPFLKAIFQGPGTSKDVRQGGVHSAARARKLRSAKRTRRARTSNKASAFAPASGGASNFSVKHYIPREFLDGSRNVLCFSALSSYREAYRWGHNPHAQTRRLQRKHCGQTAPSSEHTCRQDALARPGR